MQILSSHFLSDKDAGFDCICKPFTLILVSFLIITALSQMFIDSIHVTKLNIFPQESHINYCLTFPYVIILYQTFIKRFYQTIYR